MSLNENLRREVEAALRRRQAEREAQAQLTAELTAPEDENDTRSEIVWDKLESDAVADIDEESDRIHERVTLETEQELKQARAALTQLCELWVRAGSSQRALALTALTSASTPVQLSQDEPYSHLCEPELICVTCLTPILAELPDRAQAAIKLTAQTPPLDGLTLAEIGSDRLVEGVLTLHRPKVKEVTGPDSAPTGAVEVQATGTLGKKLAALIREDMRGA